jgi:hypothetical protein
MPQDDQPSPAPSARRRVLPIDRLSRRLATVRPRVTRDHARFVWLSILPVGIALISLVLSVYGVVLNRSAPEVVMTMPDRVRIAQIGSAWLYLQPRFVNTGGNQRNEVIGGMIAEVQPPSGPSVVFVWDEQGVWLYNTETRKLDWQFMADPAPMIVGPNDPQFPIGLFIAPAGWVWQPGTYRVTLIAERTIQHAPLRAGFLFMLTPTDVEVVSAPDGFLREVRTTPIS